MSLYPLNNCFISAKRTKIKEMIWGIKDKIWGYEDMSYNEDIFKDIYVCLLTSIFGYENIAETYPTKPPWECEEKEREDEEANNFSFCHYCLGSLTITIWWLSFLTLILHVVEEIFCILYIVEVSLVLRLYGIFSEMLSTQTEKGWI